MQFVTAGRYVAGFGLCLATAVPAFAQGIYTCIDGKGRRITADRPIQECIDREQAEINPSGTVRRKIGPSLTAEEKAAEEGRQARLAEERKRQQEEKKRERALLTRYPERSIHDREREASLARVDEVIATANKHIADLQAQRKKLDIDVEFFKADPSKMPVRLRRQVEENEQQQESQRRFIAAQEAEKSRIVQRYDEELAKLKPMWALQASVPGAVKR